MNPSPPFYATTWFRLSLSIIVIVGVVLLGVFGLQEFFFSQQILQQSNGQLHYAAQGVAQVVENWAADATTSALALARQSGLKAGGAEDQMDILENYRMSRRGLLFAATIAQDGELLARSDQRCNPLLSGCAEYLAVSTQDVLDINYAGKLWFEKAVRNSSNQTGSQTANLVGVDLADLTGSDSEAGLVTILPLAQSSTSSNVGNGSLKTPEFLILVYSASDLVDIFNLPRLSTASSFFVLDQDDQILFLSDRSLSQGLTDTAGKSAARSSQQIPFLNYKTTDGSNWQASAVALPNQWLVVYQQPAAQIFPFQQMDFFSSGGIFAASLILLCVLITLVIWRGLMPVQLVLQAANEAAEDHVAKIVRLPVTVHNSADLTGLVTVFDRMLIQLRDAVKNIEFRVQERTQVLEQRTAQLQSVVQVSRQAAQIRDLQQLLKETTRIVSAQFGFYHAGIFIVDQEGEYAILRAANSSGGQQMLDRQHKLKVGKEGIVGYVASTGQPRIALDVGADAVFFNNPDLPGTRSEMALPLVAALRPGGTRQVIGVLDVQSLEPDAFQPDDIGILQVLADQISLAMENARLFEESRIAYEELNRQYSSRTLQSWAERLHGRPLAYRYDRISIQPLRQVGELGQETPWVLNVPIRSQVGGDQGGAELGYISLRRDESDSPWSSEERILVEDSLAQIIPALENARLLEEIQQSAKLDNLVGQITTRLTESFTLDSVMSKTVLEIGSALGAKRVRIQLAGQKNGDPS